MLHLKPHNLLIQKTFSEALEAAAAGAPLTLDRIISDFDYTTFHISNSPEDKALLWLSIRTKAWQSIATCDGNKNGLLPFLESKFTSYPSVSIPSSFESGYDYTLQIDLKSLDAATVLQLSLVKTLIFNYPFHLSFSEFIELSKQQPVTDDFSMSSSQSTSKSLYTIRYRDDENIFIKPSNDRITVIFETIFQDETDKVFGKVFLQEFVDARKRNRSIQSAPQVLFSHEPPLELQQHQQGSTNTDKSRRFITFVLFPRHFQTVELQFSTVCQLTLFRNYFHYHIKCSKAYMHSRMRYRVDSFIKVLNRAKLDEDDEETIDEKNQPHQRRTFTGRKMVY
ncbi:Arc35p NDAI_0I00150 [Naumovozyma dairenensis CBS 421]|uniref:Arp2/3 complex 34 kDa subunit n=1 Tax=Naumovozyma dairenensis (strain ATCC 10597 / BCRC 20456 / CBS 421 / NBRC 0211 / NRRL Y-12639) TaxID=1071378 RepID=G0WFM3_NAUDC|nr:hypothetical protein NDAI_0I00150 [Naumovozyma dairenensis CBS 421]CCD26584.1 hypothetical protein NDAI_0I00150 [Naumovozyma dairenensis CBS 421]